MIPTYVKEFIERKRKLSVKVSIIQDIIIKRYKIASNQKLSKGVRRLILNSIR